MTARAGRALAYQVDAEPTARLLALADELVLPVVEVLGVKHPSGSLEIPGTPSLRVAEGGPAGLFASTRSPAGRCYRAVRPLPVSALRGDEKRHRTTVTKLWEHCTIYCQVIRNHLLTQEVVVMRFKVLEGALAGALALGLVAPAAGSTLVRASLEDLVAVNRLVLVGEVVDTHSYWNSEGTFILTDVRIAASSVLKGSAEVGEVVVTIPGGSVGDLATVIVGGAELVPGRSYVLFLNEENLPGARALTVRDLCQGVFDFEQGEGGLRAISQANRHPLLPDAHGEARPPGGAEGLPFEAMVRTIRSSAGRELREEVK